MGALPSPLSSASLPRPPGLRSGPPRAPVAAASSSSASSSSSSSSSSAGRDGALGGSGLLPVLLLAPDAGLEGDRPQRRPRRSVSGGLLLVLFLLFLLARKGPRAASGSVQLPGPYPRTPEERAAAAKKYNIRLEDYEPYPDDGMGYGDYPKLPDKSQEERNPYYDWDHPDLRRNYGEPVHWDFDMYLRHRVDTSPTILSFDTMQYWLFGFIALLFALTFLGELFPYYQPMAPKQYPFDHENQKIGEKPKRLKHYEI